MNMSLSKIHLKENIGIVGGEASLSKFKFFITPLKNIVTRIGDYILIDHPIFGEHCPVLAIVKDIENFEEVIGATLGEKSVQTMAVGQVLGFLDLRVATKTGVMPLRQMLVPVRPGARVYLPYNTFLQAIFSRNLEGHPFIHTVHLGVHHLAANDEHGVLRDINLYLDVVDVCNQHTLLTSMTGSGKTHTACIITEELVNKYDHNVIIFDPHGEYTTIGANKPNFEKHVKQFGGLVSEYPFNLRTSIYASQYKETVNTLINHKIELGKESNYLVTPIKTLSKAELTLRKLTIFNMSGLSPKVRGSLFTDCILALYEGRMQNQFPPFFLIVEEAGTLINNPEAAALLQRIASEGLKYGISMCLLSQHPAELNNKILSQMGIQIMGRIVDPEDLECLKYMAQEKVSSLPNFRVGEWLINGVPLLHPTKIRVRERYSKHP
jgi:DNA helicase HerA-like ATPase